LCSVRSGTFCIMGSRDTRKHLRRVSLFEFSQHFCGRSIEICIGLSEKHGCRMYNDVDEEVIHSRSFIFSFRRYLEGINEYRSSVMFFSSFFFPFFLYFSANLLYLSLHVNNLYSCKYLKILLRCLRHV